MTARDSSPGVTEAAKTFHTRWRVILGLDYNSEVPKEHWTRIKALTRRPAEGWSDEYGNLKPVAELRHHLQAQVYLMLQLPERWSKGEPSEDEKQTIPDTLSNAVTNGLVELTRRRLRDEVRLGRQEAYLQKGPGSTFVRARIIAGEVYERGAPIPTVTASPDQNRFLRDVAASYRLAGTGRRRHDGLEPDRRAGPLSRAAAALGPHPRR